MRAMVRDFVSQPVSEYRDFQVVFTILTVNFFVPAVVYLFAPDLAYGELDRLCSIFGWELMASAERGSEFWRFLGFSNVFTLGFMCLLLQLDLRRWHPVLLPLLVLKGASVVGAAWLFLFGSGHPFFALAVGFDGVTMAAMIVFASRAHRALPDGDVGLVPAPRFRAG
jgi:hypothetical protein